MPGRTCALDVPCAPGMEELQNSPQLDLETEEMEREMDDAERLMERGVAMATEESDAETVSLL